LPSNRQSPRDNGMEFDKLDGIEIDDEDEVNNEIDINEI
jgi:hypothetical protein